MEKAKKTVKTLSLSDVPTADPTQDVTPPVVGNEPIPTTDPTPIETKHLGANIQTRRGIPKPLAGAWTKATAPLLLAYRNTLKVATTQSAHIRAYEAAVTTLHNQYLDQIQSAAELPDDANPQALALDLAKKHCGLPAPPKADLRFRVEACWTSFNLRFQLVEIGAAIAEVLQGATFSQDVRERWFDFLDFIISSVERDAGLAVQAAEEAQSYRQVIKTVLFSMEARYRACNQRVACRASRASPDLLQTFKDESRKGCSEAKLTMAQQGRNYRQAMPSLVDQTWLYDNFVAPAQKIIERWDSLETRINRGVFYDTVSDEEKRSIIKAFSDGFLGFCECDHHRVRYTD